MIRDAIVRAAELMGSDQPEDDAHDIILQALSGNVRIRKSPRAYIVRAVTNRIRDRGRRPRHGYLHAGIHDRHVYASIPWPDNIAPLVAWLLEYGENSGPRTGAARVRAMRYRRQVRDAIGGMT